MSGGQTPAPRQAWLPRREGLLAVAAVLLLFAVRVPFVTGTLEDIDSVNFALGLVDYDPVEHRPHPPGYPVYVVMARLVHAVVPDESTALSLLSALAGSILFLPLYAVIRPLVGTTVALLAAVLTVVNPLVWFNAARPMSDSLGLLAVLTAQSLLVGGLARLGSGAGGGLVLWALGAAVAGVAWGVRLQALVLVLPLLVLGVVRMRRIGLATATCFMAGSLVWLVPLTVFSGGAQRLARAFALTMGDAAVGEPLLARWSGSAVAASLWNVLVAPWGHPALAFAVLVLAGAGVVVASRRHRPALLMLVALFGPYAGYHFLMQETETVRYAIPVVPLVTALAAIALGALARPRLAAGATLAMAAASAGITLPALIDYRDVPSPPLAAMSHVRKVAPANAAVTGHYLFTRYLSYTESGIILPPHPGREWRTLTEYWRTGGRRPVFVLQVPDQPVVPPGTVQGAETLGRWHWPAHVTRLLPGARPADVEVVRVDAPLWFRDEWPSDEAASAPGQDSSRVSWVFVRADAGPQALAIKGASRGLGSAVAIEARGERVARWEVQGEFLGRTTIAIRPEPDEHYIPLAVRVGGDLQVTDLLVIPSERGAVLTGEGFGDEETDPDGLSFRWLSATGHADVYVPAGGGATRVRGQVPLERYVTAPVLTARWNGVEILREILHGPEFDLALELSADASGDWGDLVLGVDQTFVPAETEASTDTRRLSVRIYELVVVPAEAAWKARATGTSQ